MPLRNQHHSATDAWEYAEASDLLLGEDLAAVSDHVAKLTAVAEGAVFLCKDQHRLETRWRSQVAVIGHCDSLDDNLGYAITE
jgi:hypothetical protein